MLIDATTGTVLFDKKANERMPTSSMSKIMTMYLVFDAIKQGKLKLDEMVPVSEHAWKMEGSRMFIDVGTQVKVEDLIRGVAIQSGNDASVALAEAVGGTEESFANRMNETAAKLGLTNSHFVNATGLPDPQHYSTPDDLAKLSLALMRDFPEDYRYFGEHEFTYNKIKQGNRNPLLYRNIGVDGVKTGHAEDAGYGMIASAVRDGRRLVLVVNGLSDMQARADESARLLEYGFHEFSTYAIAKAGQKLASAKTWLGESAEVSVVAAQDIAMTLPVSARGGLHAAIEYQQPVTAPIAKGQKLGKLIVTVPGSPAVETPLIAGESVARKGFFASLAAKLSLLLGGKQT